MGETPRLWDHTALDCLERCPEEFVQRYVHHRASPIPDASALFGQAVHAGIAALWAGQGPAEAGRIAAKFWTDVLTGGGVEGRAESIALALAKKPHLTPEYAYKVVELYGQQYPAAYRGELLMNEQYLEMPEARICGVVDRVTRRPDGSIVVRDLKTSGLRMDDRWAEQWAHNLQTGSFYLDLAEYKLGVPIDTVWIDAIHVDRRGYPKPEDYHMFGPFRYSPELRGELRLSRGSLIIGADRLCETPETALKRTRNCFRYNQVCSFFRYCRTDFSMRESAYDMAMASGELVKREWKPEKRDE